MASDSRKKPNRLRIIGGQWRSRLLHFPDVPELRPTPDRVRETLFNWLQLNIVGAQCLDLFAGSGALGFEALSRGATCVLALEQDKLALQALRENCRVLDTEKFELLPGSALEWLQHGKVRKFNIVFMDPPFASQFHSACCALLQQREWLAPGALVYLEAGEPLNTITLPDNWTRIREKKAGEVFYGLCQST